MEHRGRIEGSIRFQQNMNILQVIPYFVPAWNYGGPVSSAYKLSRELVKRGYSVTVYTTDTLNSGERLKNNDEIIDGIRVKRFKNLSNSIAWNHRVFISPSMVSGIRNNLEDFDVVHLQDYRTIQNVIVHHYARKYNIPYVLQAHGNLTTILHKGWLKRTFDAISGYSILKDASKLIALTPVEMEQYKSMGVSEDKIGIVPNGIDLCEFENLPQRGEFRKKWGINDSQKIILFLARIHKIKGLDLLAKAFAGLTEELDDAKLVIVGPDDGYLPALKKLIKELEIEEKVLITGSVSGEDKLEAYVDADVYVLPSIYETFPVGVLEACACGTPVVVTDRCGIADVIDGQVGLVVPYDKDQLRDALRCMLTDEGLGKRFGVEGKRLVREEFGWDKVVKKIERVYEMCL